MALNADLYDALGVPRDATTSEIKKAFREKSKHLHPDAAPTSDGEEFRRMSSAYAVLVNPEKRERYDRTGSPDGADNTTAQALSIIQGMVAKVLDELDDRPVINDIVANMREYLRDRIAEHKNGIAALRKKASRTEKLAKRFKVKSKAKRGDNLLRGIVEGKAAEMRRAVANGEAAIATFELALKIIEDSDFDPEEVARPMMYVNMPMTGFSGTSASTW